MTWAWDSGVQVLSATKEELRRDYNCVTVSCPGYTSLFWRWLCDGISMGSHTIALSKYTLNNSNAKEHRVPKILSNSSENESTCVHTWAMCTRVCEHACRGEGGRKQPGECNSGLKYIISLYCYGNFLIHLKLHQSKNYKYIFEIKVKKAKEALNPSIQKYLSLQSLYPSSNFQSSFFSPTMLSNL